MKKSYETPTIWKENRFKLSDEYMIVKISKLNGQMQVSDEETIDIVEGVYGDDYGKTGFSGPSAKERKEEEWGRLW